MHDQPPMLTYKAFVDEMVALARRSISASRLAAHGHTERTNDADLPLDDRELSKRYFSQGLPSEQKVILAELLIKEREGAIHDALAFLEWAVSTERLQVVGADGPFANEIEETMHGDFISRLGGYEWQAA